MVTFPKGLNITSTEAKAFKGATPAQIAQAESLILRGKAGAVRGDPILQPIVNVLSAFGLQSVQARKFKAEALERQRVAEEKQRALLDAQQKKGVIFLTKKEVEKRGIAEGEKRVLSTQEIRAQEAIELSEKILGQKDSGAGFILGESARQIKADKAVQMLIRRIQKKERLAREGRIIKDIGTLKSEVSTIKSAGRQASILGLAVASSTVENVKGLKQLPSAVKTIFTEVKKDPKNIVKLGKEIPNILKKETEDFVELYRISPTEAIGRIGGTLLFFKGTGTALRLVGKVGKIPAKAIKTSLKGKAGTRVRLIGTQSVSGNKIITKIIFSKGKRQLGGAVGVSVVKGKRVFTQVVGKTGKVGRIKKKFKEKGVFVGREVSISTSQRSNLITTLKLLRNKRKLTLAEKKLLFQLRRKGKRGRTIKITKGMKGIFQVGIGRVAQAPGKKLLRTILTSTGKLKKVKAKGFTRKDFVSISKIFTKKDLSLIVGKTFSKKKNILEFIGLIKGTSGKSLKSFSVGQQRLFRRAISDVVGVASASTQKGRNVIPKLSSKAKNLIVQSTGVSIVKGKALLKPVTKITPKQKQVLVKKTKQISIAQTKLKIKQKVLVKQSEKITTEQKILSKQKQTPNVKQKQKQLVKQKSNVKQRQRLLQRQGSRLRQRKTLITKQVRTRVPGRPAKIPLVKFPIGLIKTKKKIKRKRVKKPKKKFTAEIKRFGKWKKVGSFNTKLQAKSGGIKRAKNTLGASIRIKKDGKILKVKTTKQFRRSKVDSRVLVQKKKKISGIGSRLGTKAEISALRRAKRKATPQQLKNLAKGRKKLAQKRKGGKK